MWRKRLSILMIKKNYILRPLLKISILLWFFFSCYSVPSVVWSHDQAEEEDHWWSGDSRLLKENKLIIKLDRENKALCCINL